MGHVIEITENAVLISYILQLNIRSFCCKTDDHLSYITEVFGSSLKKKCSLEIKTELF